MQRYRIRGLGRAEVENLIEASQGASVEAEVGRNEARRIISDDVPEIIIRAPEEVAAEVLRKAGAVVRMCMMK